jgi:thiol-disulfide isomerase/thioredoxin
MKKTVLILFMLTTVSLFGCNRNASQTNNDMQNDNISTDQLSTPASTSSDLNTDNKTAPNFSLTDVNGKAVSLAQFKGKVVIIDFWATWCPPCRRGIPDLISIQKEFKNKVAIIGISLDTDTKAQVVPFMKSMGINYHVVYGTNDVVSAYGNIEAIPTSFVIDQNGKIVAQHVGLTPKETYIEEINQLLKKS